MRILLIEDDDQLADVLLRGLRDAGHEVTCERNGLDGIQAGMSPALDALVVDWMLPGEDGPGVCRTLRARGVRTPIIMLTARHHIGDRVTGLDAGADDYLTKPFDFGELLARLRALIRRGNRAPLPERFAVGPLTLDTRARQVRRGSNLVPLTIREYALLEFLARRLGQVVGRADIAEHVWDEGYDPMSNVIDVYIQRLRRKIDDPAGASMIQTRRGEGYALMTGEP